MMKKKSRTSAASQGAQLQSHAFLLHSSQVILRNGLEMPDFTGSQLSIAPSSLHSSLLHCRLDGNCCHFYFSNKLLLQCMSVLLVSSVRCLQHVYGVSRSR